MGLGSNHCEHDIDENYCHICRDEIIQVQSVEIEQLKAVAIAAKTVLRDALDRNDDEWNRYATSLLKVELSRAGIGYDELIKRLDAIGVQESYKGLAAKINRGTFSLVFFAQCMQALGVKLVRLSE